MHMRAMLTLVLLLEVAAGCSRAREYELVGQVLAVNTDRREITIKHEDIRGFMPGMTMAFKVRDVRQMEGRVPGDLVKATLVVEESEGYLMSIKRTGHRAVTDVPPSSEGPADLLEPGAPIPDVQFTDQAGIRRRLSDWRGRLLAVTFIYTRCPVPDFCPRMNRNFAAVQAALQSDAGLRGRVQLLSVSIDPEFDSPIVLSEYARQAGADSLVWSFVTGDPDDIDPFVAGFGVSIIREATATGIVHNLRTVIISADGRLVTMLRGNEWTSDELVAALRNAG